MKTSQKLLLRLCLAGTALASAAAFHPAQAAGFDHAYLQSDVIGAAADTQKVDFRVFLPLRDEPGLAALIARQQSPGSADYHKWLTPAQFAARFGPEKSTVDAVARELAAAGFSVTTEARSLHVTGTASMVARAFGARLMQVHGIDGARRLVALDGLRMSPTLQKSGARIIAFANRKVSMHPNSVVANTVNPDNRSSSTGGYYYDDLKQAYGYPAANATVTISNSTRLLNGSGATIAALMSSDIIDSDIKAMFQNEHYLAHASGPIPSVTHEYLAGAQPGVLTGAVYEASLDTQQEIGGAPGAKVILYDIPDLSDSSVIAGYTAIDNLNEADVVSSSFGLCELYYTPAYNNGVDYTYIPQTYHQLFEQGNSQGITFLASSGDGAGRECVSVSYFEGSRKANYVPGPSSPATDPNITAVGGTNLVTSYVSYDPTKLRSVYVGENAWSDPMLPDDPYGIGNLVYGKYWGAGGGPSVLFAKPDYQTVHTVSTMRSTPDVGMQVGGCPIGAYTPCNGGDLAINGNGNTQRSYVIVYVGGTAYGLIGTSVSSPEFASAVGIMVELHGRQGNLNPYLYQTSAAQLAGTLSSPALHSAVPGWNSVHSNLYPGNGYNYTTGVGTPYVAALIGVPAGTPLAGNPQTPSNP